MLTDLVLEPFGAATADLLAVARAADAEGSGIDGVWVYDHFTAMMSTADWSRDPMTLLGALATTTERITIGPLVANIYNRHVVQLASAINTVQDLAGERVLLGIGSGAAPGSKFAAEHEAIGTALQPAADRRRALSTAIADLRAVWANNRLGAATSIVDGRRAPPIIVGASGEQTVRVAAEHADGVNIRASDRLEELIAVARTHAVRDHFETSVIEHYQPGIATPDRLDRYRELGVDRCVLALSAPYPHPIFDGGRVVL